MGVLGDMSFKENDPLFVKIERFKTLVKEQVNEKIAPELLRLDRNPILLRRILERTSERFYLSMRGLEKLDDALSQSKNLFEQKFFLERNFEKS